MVAVVAVAVAVANNQFFEPLNLDHLSVAVGKGVGNRFFAASFQFAEAENQQKVAAVVAVVAVAAVVLAVDSNYQSVVHQIEAEQAMVEEIVENLFEFRNHNP